MKFSKTFTYFPFILFLGICVFQTPSSHAVEIVDEWDQVYQGDVLDEDATSFYLDTPGGVINIQKSKIKLLDSKPYGKPKPVETVSPAPAATKSSSSGKSSTQSSTNRESEEKFAIQVGESGLTESELSIYTRGLNSSPRFEHLSGLDWGTDNIEIRKAIEDEITFQEALRAGVHKKGNIRKDIIDNYRANQTLSDIDPGLFTEEEMLVFYHKNKKEFMTPAEQSLKMATIIGSDEERDARLEKIKNDPESETEWRSAGWHKIGESFHIPLTDSQEEEIEGLRKGEVSDLIPVSMGSPSAYVFWCLDYKPPVQKSFEQARERVKHLMIKEKQTNNTEALHSRVGKKSPGTGLEDAIFDEAVQAGTHRDRSIRSDIINTYLRDKGTTLKQVVLAAKGKYPVKINQA